MKTLPSFQLKDQSGKEWSNTQLLGKWCALFVYPKDHTPGCSRENLDFSEHLEAFQLLDCEVLGVSPDTVAEHQQFCEKLHLQHHLLADPEKQLLIPIGGWGEKKNYGRVYQGVIRSTYLISPKGEIVKSWKNVKVEGHALRVLETLKKLCSK